jgi:fatty acid desaturase
MTAQPACARTVSWYRTPLDSAVFKQLHKKSDFWGALQTLGYLGTLVLTGSTAYYSASHWPVVATILLLFLHGTCCAFQINAVHELGHGTVFKTKFWNEFFVRIFSFFGWINFEHFGVSHARHHRYTLHAPDDLEVVLPIKVLRKDFFKYGFVNLEKPKWIWYNMRRNARGEFPGEWNAIIFPEGSPARRAPIMWARFLLAGHACIILFSIWFHLWMLPVVTTFVPMYGEWLLFLCNNTQHIGLRDDVPDFRLCCRTFTLNPVVQFLYWHMNYHIEHHMYAAVPCYRLGQLHRAIKHDLAPCPHGLVATWKEIAAIQAKQEKDPEYQYDAPVPNRPSPPQASPLAPEGLAA